MLSIKWLSSFCFLSIHMNATITRAPFCKLITMLSGDLALSQPFTRYLLAQWACTSGSALWASCCTLWPASNLWVCKKQAASGLNYGWYTATKCQEQIQTKQTPCCVYLCCESQGKKFNETHRNEVGRLPTFWHVPHLHGSQIYGRNLKMYMWR